MNTSPRHLLKLFFSFLGRFFGIKFIIISILYILALSGCATKQWGPPLAEDQQKSVRSLIQAEREKRSGCSCCIDAGMTAKLTSQVSNGAITGYLQIFKPSSIKIIAINPMDQPVFALATNGKNFQAINAVKGVFKFGRLSTFADKHDIPDDVLDGDWVKWLTGSIDYSDAEIEEIQEDLAGRGIWLTIVQKEAASFLREHLLFDAKEKMLRQRIMLDRKGDEIASINYSSWQSHNGCPLPTSLHIKGISFGAEIDISLEDFLVDQDFTKDNFYLKLPPGYIQQRYP